MIEEVQNFKYLGFNFNRNRNYDNHIRELARKGKLAANKVWGLEERICREDFNKIWTLFRYLVESDGIWRRNMGLGEKERIRKN